jgi:hypothetical protein
LIQELRTRSSWSFWTRDATFGVRRRRRKRRYDAARRVAAGQRDLGILA